MPLKKLETFGLQVTLTEGSANNPYGVLVGLHQLAMDTIKKYNLEHAIATFTYVHRGEELFKPYVICTCDGHSRLLSPRELPCMSEGDTMMVSLTGYVGE